MSNLEADSPTYLSYYVRFGLILVVLYVIIAVVRVFFSADGVTGFAFVLPGLTAQFVSEAFIKKQKRVPTDRESAQLSRGCLLVAVLVNVPFSLIGFLAGDFGQGLSSMAWAIVGALLLVWLVVNYLLIRWAFGSVAKKRADKLGIGRPEDNF